MEDVVVAVVEVEVEAEVVATAFLLSHLLKPPALTVRLVTVKRRDQLKLARACDVARRSIKFVNALIQPGEESTLLREMRQRRTRRAVRENQETQPEEISDDD